MVTSRELHRKHKQWMMASGEQHLALAFAFCEQNNRTFSILKPAARPPPVIRLSFGSKIYL
jgi:hypothetical protein